MAFFTALAAVASTIAGIGSLVNASTQRKDLAKAQKNQLTAAQEAAALKRVRTDAGASVSIGAAESTTGHLSRTPTRTSRTSSGSAVGGVSASYMGGL